ncbi:NAD(P)/FAD-dependent oxidoreductase [Streptomyces sp. PTM05]|uniref:NAD(P)/FAD-dependent oxidoreductase n=1 Tax=Streptantibioticus parmotrematis TaxID=2873249 RepID=A0ABS7QQB0_9ACTN|nr:FAD/NAD(P)-binding oxidoreductase [Streptantibioticus parmotrematis]MBY8885381.1 NAD(P)/FAD-dependent oxidoreductase [Streptantibioticus parmotrematis]
MRSSDVLTADVAVVGAGPAGLAAAGEAAAAGLDVVVVDAGARPGGQYWRHGPGAEGPAPGTHGRGTFSTLRAGLGRHGVRLVCGHQVWQAGRHDDGFVLRLRPVHDFPHDDAVERVSARRLIVCTGGYDRQLPVPGWDLPGVMAAGGAQALLKEYGTVPGQRVVVAGTGPFLVAVAAGLAEAGARVVAVCEANAPVRGWLRRPLAALGEPAKAVEAVRYAAALARHRVPYRTRTAVTRVHGDDSVRAVDLTALDHDGRPREATRTTVPADLVALGWGFTPSLDLLLTLGAATRLDGDGSLVVRVDDGQRTTVPGLYAAGETTGIAGATQAVREGLLSGLAVTADLGRAGRTGDGVDAGPSRSRRAARLRSGVRRGRRFAEALHAACPVPAGWTAWLAGDTVVCRCEEVPFAAVCHAVRELGAEDPRTVKMLARPGMGMCQGRVCGFATALITRHLTGHPSTAEALSAFGKRPLAAPVTLAELAASDDRTAPRTAPWS